MFVVLHQLLVWHILLTNLPAYLILTIPFHYFTLSMCVCVFRMCVSMCWLMCWMIIFNSFCMPSASHSSHLPPDIPQHNPITKQFGAAVFIRLIGRWLMLWVCFLAQFSLNYNLQSSASAPRLHLHTPTPFILSPSLSFTLACFTSWSQWFHFHAFCLVNVFIFYFVYFVNFSALLLVFVPSCFFFVFFLCFLLFFVCVFLEHEYHNPLYPFKGYSNLIRTCVTHLKKFMRLESDGLS